MTGPAKCTLIYIIITGPESKWPAEAGYRINKSMLISHPTVFTVLLASFLRKEHVASSG